MNPIIKKNGINWGIGLGIFSVVMGTIVYAMQLYSSIGIGVGIILLSIVLYCVMLSKTKKEMGGEMTFKEAFTVFFIATVISMLIAVVFNIVLFNYIDPEAKAMVMDAQIENTVATMEKFNAPASEINKAIDKIKAEDQYSVANQIKGFFIGICGMSVLGLILALIFKSRPKYQE